MWTVCWMKNGKDFWDRCENSREVRELLEREGLVEDEDVLIFKPEANQHVVNAWEV